jgi:DNA polymerase-3 subunit delta
MIFKSYVLEKNTDSTDNCKMLLFYGENQGLRQDFKEIFKLKNKDNEILNLFQDEIIKNKNILINEIANKSLFKEKKIIFINEATDKILESLELITDNVDEEKIVIFSDALDKKSKLRSYFEKSENCGTVPCYKDNEITIKKIIIEKLNGYKGLSTQVLNIIINSSGLDRNKINNEIEKIKSCFSDKVIDGEKIDLLLNIRTNDDFNDLKDEALKGNKIKTNRLLADTVFGTENNIFYLNSINQRINKLSEIISLKQDIQNIEALISGLKPPIFWKDKPILIAQSKIWNKEKIQKALSKTYEAEIEVKSNSKIRKDLVIKNLIVELCTTASAS